MIYAKISLRADKAREIAKTKNSSRRAKKTIMFIIVFFVFGGFFLLRNETKAQDLVKVKEVSEVLELRTEKAITYKISDTVFTKKIYGTKQWEYDKTDWKIYTPEIKEETPIINKLLMIPSLWATTTSPIYETATDGSLVGWGADWSTTWASSTAGDLFNSGSFFLTKTADDTGDKVYIIRSGLSFDIDIPAGTEIASSTLFLYVTTKLNEDNDGLDYVHFSQGNFATSSMTVNDYDETGLYTDAYTINKDFGDITTSQYNEFEFNETGLEYLNLNKNDWVTLMARSGHDVENTPIATGTENSIRVDYSEQSGVATDPYILITYIDEPETPTTTPEETPTTTPPTLEGGGLIDYIYITDSTGSTSYMYIPFLNYLVVIFTIFPAGLIIYLAVKL